MLCFMKIFPVSTYFSVKCGGQQQYDDEERYSASRTAGESRRELNWTDPAQAGPSEGAASQLQITSPSS